MGFGLGTLRLSPQVFWSMTPREFAAAARALHGIAPSPMDAAALAALRTRYPDIPHDP